MSSIEPVFEKIAARAKVEGCEVELLVERGERFSVSFRDGRPEQFDTSSSHCAGFRVIENGSEGYAYTENLSEDALVQTYENARSNAQLTGIGADPAKKVRLLGETTAVEPRADLFDPSFASLAVEKKLETARRLESVALGVDSRIASVPRNGYSESLGEIEILTSTGIRRRQRATGLMAYASCLAKSGEENRMASEARFTRRAGDFDADTVSRAAAEKALAKLGAKPPQTGMYPVVIDHRVASQFFGLISDYFSAKAVAEKQSLFANDRGSSIASEKITLVDDPFVEGGIGTRAFDSEGAASRRTVLVERGRLENFLTNSVYAERMGLAHTASASRGARSELGIGPSNLVVQKGTVSFEKLMAIHPKTIYVTDLMGFHAGFKSGSGDFSLQAEGELWENGEKVRPLCNFVVSGNVRELLKKVEEISSRARTDLSSVVAPDLLISELSIAGA